MALVRNKGCVPYLESEGAFARPLPVYKGRTGTWWEGLTPCERMFSHHTLASARRYAHFKPFSGLIPEDALDVVLFSPYDHSREVFPDPADPRLQPETVGARTWRRLRNTRQQTQVRDPNANPAVDVVGGFAAVSDQAAALRPQPPTQGFAAAAARGHRLPPYRYNDYHPVLISGITEKRHPSNVKLMLSSHHSPQTNAGYSRQDSDGTVFQY